MPIGLGGNGAAMPGSPPRRCLILLAQRAVSVGADS